LNARIPILIFLLIADVGSALGVVYARHQSRELSMHLGLLEARRDEAVAEWSRLQLEQAWRADAGNIEKNARERLGMVQPDNGHILVIRP